MLATAVGSAVGLVAAEPAHAVFTDATVFHLAAGGSPGPTPDSYEDFNSIIPNANGRLWTPPISPFTLTDSGDEGNVIDSNSAQTIDGSVLLQANIDNTSGSDTLTFTFDAPIKALGFYIDPNPFVLGHTVLFTTDVLSEMGSYDLPTADAPEFRGFIFSIPVIQFTIDAAPDDNFASHGIDNVEVYYDIIPEPASFAAFTAPMLLWIRKRG